MLTHTFNTCCEEMKRKWTKREAIKPSLIYKNYKSIQIMKKYKLTFQPNQTEAEILLTGFCNLPKIIHNWPRNMCGCSLPHSCVGRCHRIYTPLAKRFGSLQEQKSSAPPSPTLLPFMCSAEKGKTPSTVTNTRTHTHTQAQMFIHTHTTDSISNKCR